MAEPDRTTGKFVGFYELIEACGQPGCPVCRRVTEDLAALSGVTLETTIRQGHEVETIVTTAKEGKFDLLVIGYRGHSNIFGRIMGSTAQSIVRLAPCPVLLAK